MKSQRSSYFLRGLALCSILFPSICLGAFQGKTEFGYESSIRTNDGSSSLQRPYLIQGLEFSPELGESSGLASLAPDRILGQYRAWGNFSFVTSNSGEKTSVDLRLLKAEWRRGDWSIDLGLQNIVWGETFGVRVIDVINPRDYSDYLLTPLDWSIIPVWGARVQRLVGPLRVEAVYVAKTERDRFPIRIGDRKLVDLSQDPKAFEDAEYGGRAGILLPTGTDVNLYYYRHFNRVPVIQYVSGLPESGTFAIIPPEKVHTVGLSFTHALEEWVLRGDFAYDWDAILTSPTFGSPVRGNPLQAVLGADWSGPDRSIFGFQYQFNNNPRENSPYHWLSARGTLSFLNGDLLPELLILKGLNNKDLWFNPGIAYHFAPKWTAEVRADLVTGQSGSLFSLYEGENRVIGRLSYLLD